MIKFLLRRLSCYIDGHVYSRTFGRLKTASGAQIHLCTRCGKRKPERIIRLIE